MAGRSISYAAIYRKIFYLIGVEAIKNGILLRRFMSSAGSKDALSTAWRLLFRSHEWNIIPAPKGLRAAGGQASGDAVISRMSTLSL
jgi:hypothetical protein